jgi:hypothetical protein
MKEHVALHLVAREVFRQVITQQKRADIMYVGKTILYLCIIFFETLYIVRLRKDIEMLANAPPIIRETPSSAAPVTIIVIEYQNQRHELFSVLNAVGMVVSKEQKKGVEDILSGDKKITGFRGDTE